MIGLPIKCQLAERYPFIKILYVKIEGIIVLDSMSLKRFVMVMTRRVSRYLFIFVISLDLDLASNKNFETYFRDTNLSPPVRWLVRSVVKFPAGNA